MIQSILLLVVIATIIWLYRKWTDLPDKERNQLSKKYLLWSLAGILLLMVLTGKTHWLFALLAAFLAFFQRIMQVLQYLPLFKKLFGSFADTGKYSQQNNQTPQNNKTMTRHQAADILGIKETASKQEVVAAHRRLMQKVHPDRGGSDVLAAQINEAKKVMLA